MPGVFVFRLSEDVRQQLFPILIALDVLLSCFGILTLMIGAYMRHTVPDYSDLLEGMDDIRGMRYGLAGQYTSLNFLIVVCIISIFVHFCAIKIWVDLIDFYKRRLVISTLRVFLIIRGIYFLLLLISTIVTKIEDHDLVAALQMSIDKLGYETSPMSIGMADNVGWILITFCLIEVKVLSFSYCSSILRLQF